eukprot:7948909-Lingulodinium_polyedra.AAC.1
MTTWAARPFRSEPADDRARNTRGTALARGEAKSTSLLESPRGGGRGGGKTTEDTTRDGQG